MHGLHLSSWLFATAAAHAVWRGDAMFAAALGALTATSVAYHSRYETKSDWQRLCADRPHWRAVDGVAVAVVSALALQRSRLRPAAAFVLGSAAGLYAGEYFLGWDAACVCHWGVHMCGAAGVHLALAGC